MFCKRKRGLILLVIAFFIVVFNFNTLGSEDNEFFCGSIRFTECDANGKFCGSNNLISNGGFEVLDGDGNLRGFVRQENPEIYLLDSYRGSNSIRLDSSFESYDYRVSLNTSKEYLFLAYVKGSCNEVKVYYGEQLGGAQEICNGHCGSVNPGEEWRQIAAQFTPSFGSGYLRVECISGGELLVDSMHLQEIPSEANENSLIDNCAVCGCIGDYKCLRDGSCGIGEDRSISFQQCEDGTLIGSCNADGMYCEEINLVNNPGFESRGSLSTPRSGGNVRYYSDNLPPNWNKNSDAERLSFGIGWGSFGNYDMRINVPEFSRSDQYPGIKSDMIPLEENARYRVKAMVYCEGCESEGVGEDNSVINVHMNVKKSSLGMFVLDFHCQEANCKTNYQRIERSEKGYDRIEFEFTTGNTGFLSSVVGFVIISFNPNSKGIAWVDEVVLEKIGEEPVLFENCEVCGGCTTVAKSVDVPDQPLAIQYVLDNNLDAIRGLSPLPLKKLAIDQYSLNNRDISVCGEGTQDCIGKTLALSCLEASDKDQCKRDILEGPSIPNNPNFLPGRVFRMVYGDHHSVNERGMELWELRLTAGTPPSDNYCIFEVRASEEIYTEFSQDIPYDFGTIIQHEGGDPLYILSRPAKEGIDYCEGYCPTLHQSSFPFDMRRSCRDAGRCNIIDNDQIKPKADILCGFDSKWYLCDQVGIKTFANGKKYLCTNKKWMDIS